MVLLGCKKGRADFTLRGLITNGTFSGVITGAVLNLYEVEAGGGTTTLIGTQNITDGYYSFTFKRNKVESYIIEVSKPNYFDLYETVNFADMTLEEDNVYDYQMTAKSWVNLHFVNSTPQPNDQLKYIKIDGKEGCPECCEDTEQFLNGAVDTNIYCINDGNTLYSYNYWVIGTIESGHKSVSTTAFDTTEILLTY